MENSIARMKFKMLRFFLYTLLTWVFIATEANYVQRENTERSPDYAVLSDEFVKVNHPALTVGDGSGGYDADNPEAMNRVTPAIMEEERSNNFTNGLPLEMVENDTISMVFFMTALPFAVSSVAENSSLSANLFDEWSIWRRHK